MLRIPPYQCEFYPTELIWVPLKGFISPINTTFKIADVQELCMHAVNRIYKEQWKNCVKHVTDVTEPKFQKLDNIMENAIEGTIINVNSGTSSKYCDKNSSPQNAEVQMIKIYIFYLTTVLYSAFKYLCCIFIFVAGIQFIFK